MEDKDPRGYMGRGTGRWLQTCRGHVGADRALQEEEGGEEDSVDVFFGYWKRSPLNEKDRLGALLVFSSSDHQILCLFGIELHGIRGIVRNDLRLEQEATIVEGLNETANI